MKKLLLGATIAVVSAFLLTATPHANAAQYGPQYNNYPYGGQSWEMPPNGMCGVEQQGYMEGIRGAEKDAENHRQWNVDNRDEYRHPRFKGWEREAYRRGFRMGYQVGAEHIGNNGYYNNH